MPWSVVPSLLFLYLMSGVCSLYAGGETQAPLKVYIVGAFHRTYWRPQLVLARELALRGHHITIQWPAEYQNTTQIPAPSHLDFPHEVVYASVGPPSHINEMYATLTDNSVYALWHTLPLSREVYVSARAEGWVSTLDSVLETTQDRSVDLLISDNSPAIQGACEILSHTHGTQCIMTTPFFIRNPESEFYLLGPGALPAWMPLSSVGHTLASSWMERIRDQALGAVIRIYYNFLLEESTTQLVAYMRTRWPEHTPDLKRLYPTLLNAFEGWDWNVPIPPHVRYIGPIDRQVIAQKIEQAQAHSQSCRARGTCSELDLFLDSHDTVIVVSFGKSVELREEHIQAVIGLARHLAPIPVLWTLRERHVALLPPASERPDTLRIVTWVDLVSVMAHPHTRGLVSQCGAATVMESFLTSTSLLCVPILYDQYDNGVLVEHHRLGQVLPPTALHVESLSAAVRSLLDRREMFSEHASRLQQLAALQTPIEEVAEWVEMLAREGTDWLFPSSPSVFHPPWYQHAELFYLGAILWMASQSILLGVCWFSRWGSSRYDHTK